MDLQIRKPVRLMKLRLISIQQQGYIAQIVHMRIIIQIRIAHPVAVDLLHPFGALFDVCVFRRRILALQCQAAVIAYGGQTAYALLLQIYDTALQSAPGHELPAFRDLKGMPYRDTGTGGFDPALHVQRMIVEGLFETLHAVFRIYPGHPKALVHSGIVPVEAMHIGGGGILKVFQIVPHSHGTIGIRIPDDPFILELIAAIGKPLMVTSANLSGEASLRCWKDVYERFHGKIEGIVCEDALADSASTIIDVSKEELQILREGKISIKDIREVIE